jgi:hypothetical protein
MHLLLRRWSEKVATRHAHEQDPIKLSVAMLRLDDVVGEGRVGPDQRLLGVEIYSLMVARNHPIGLD